MEQGIVKWFNNAKGFGFILRGAGDDIDGMVEQAIEVHEVMSDTNMEETHSPGDIFVHYSVIEGQGFRTLKQGEKVEFDVQEGPKGLHAVAVRRLREAEQAAAV